MPLASATTASCWSARQWARSPPCGTPRTPTTGRSPSRCVPEARSGAPSAHRGVVAVGLPPPGEAVEAGPGVHDHHGSELADELRLRSDLGLDLLENTFGRVRCERVQRGDVQPGVRLA